MPLNYNLYALTYLTDLYRPPFTADDSI